jgi:uncharacterized membrane protein
LPRPSEERPTAGGFETSSELRRAARDQRQAEYQYRIRDTSGRVLYGDNAEVDVVFGRRRRRLAIAVAVTTVVIVIALILVIALR